MNDALKGRRVLVTRPAHQAEKLAAPLRALGAEVLLLPMLEVLPPSDPAPLRHSVRNLGTFRWIVFSSANAVRAVAVELLAQDSRLQDYPDSRVAAVGEETAHALADLGREADFVPDIATAASLAATLAPLVGGQHLLLPQQPGASPSLALALETAGAKVQRVDAYRTALPVESAAGLKALYADNTKVPDVLTFASAQSARNFYELVRDAGIPLPPNTVIASIGPATSEALKVIGAEPQVQAVRPTAESLAKAIASYFASR
jgi:uroporphyrinogen-III synthase